MKKGILTMALVGLTLGGLTTATVVPSQSVSAATFNAAKLSTGKYTINYDLKQAANPTAVSVANQYFTHKATISVAGKQNQVTVSTTKAAKGMITQFKLNGQTGKATGTTYTFKNVTFTKPGQVTFTLHVPAGPNGALMTMKEPALLNFETASLHQVGAKKAVSLTLSRVKPNAKKILGSTVVGAKVTVKHGKTVLGKATAKTKHFTVKTKAVKKNWTLTVTGTKAGYATVTKTIVVK